MVTRAVVTLVVTLVTGTLARPEPDEEATTSWIHEMLAEEDNVLGTPYNLTATNITAGRDPA